jgi:hypothetical protein
MPFIKLQFRPGINRETTAYTNEGGWIDGDKIRFRAGLPETIGGWDQYNSQAMLGVPRSLFPWASLDGSVYIGSGTQLKYYVLEGATPNDITPIRATTAAGGATFAATNGSTVLTVTDTTHGAFLHDLDLAAALAGQRGARRGKADFAKRLDQCVRAGLKDRTLLIRGRCGLKAGGEHQPAARPRVGGQRGEIDGKGLVGHTGVSVLVRFRSQNPSARLYPRNATP